MVILMAAGGPMGVLPSEPPSCPPSQVPTQVAPSKYWNVISVTSRAITCGLGRFGSPVGTSSEVTPVSSLRTRPVPGMNQMLTQRRSLETGDPSAATALGSRPPGTALLESTSQFESPRTPPLNGTGVIGGVEDEEVLMVEEDPLVLPLDDAEVVVVALLVDALLADEPLPVLPLPVLPPPPPPLPPPWLIGMTPMSALVGMVCELR